MSLHVFFWFFSPLTKQFLIGLDKGNVAYQNDIHCRLHFLIGLDKGNVAYSECHSGTVVSDVDSIDSSLCPLFAGHEIKVLSRQSVNIYGHIKIPFKYYSSSNSYSKLGLYKE